MLGAIAGDIIGSPFEFNSIKDTDFENKTNQCTGSPIKTIPGCLIAQGLSGLNDAKIVKKQHVCCRLQK